MELKLHLTKKVIEILTDDKGDVLKAKKNKLTTRAANTKGYRDLAMPTEGISLKIAENATSDKLTKGDLKKPGQGLKEDGI